jgi:type II secretory pathway component PulJ
MVKLRQEWLLIFYSVPAHPVSNRMKIWRKLAKSGAVQLKGAVYILPATDEHEELFQWLIGEVKSMGGDGAFVRSAEIQSMEATDIRDLFLSRAEEEYRGFERKLETLERKIQNIRKGARHHVNANLSDHAGKLVKELEDMHRRDFFSTAVGLEMSRRLQALKTTLRGFSAHREESVATVTLKRPSDYVGRSWFTRKKPFIDRMASAWFIRRFIDANADFKFIDEGDLSSLGANAATFDMRGGDFTHVGDLCTFEVLLKSFSVRDKVVRKIAEIIHDLDVKDDKFGNPEAPGVEEILMGIRKTAKNDADALEQGMAVFEMLYQSKTQ